MKLSIFKQDAQSAKVAPYVMAVSMKDEIIPPDYNFHVPIYREEKKDGGDPSYEVEICGLKLGAETPEGLVSPTAKLLDGLINMARMPTYVFVASESLVHLSSLHDWMMRSLSPRLEVRFSGM